MSRPENFNSNHYNFDCEALDSVQLWICILILTLLGFRELLLKQDQMPVDAIGSALQGGKLLRDFSLNKRELPKGKSP